ncbi:hypothetical protein PC118_g15317 [Phytophthora cactorum]|uniref:Uncharacterized protein n=1 Tax=Phytophthora cactorum TaxID=29920 RepID=A0A8T1FD15_9STRA|nr:hypothetical protein PC118_g15317 [Phytophthora cactorum]
MTGVDVNDPNFDVFEFLGVDWCKSSSMETSGRKKYRIVQDIIKRQPINPTKKSQHFGRADSDTAPAVLWRFRVGTTRAAAGCGREAVVFARSGDPLRGTALSAAAHIATSAYTNSGASTTVFAAPDVVSTAKVPCGRSCNGLQAKAPAGTHATEVRGTAAPAAGTAACLVASETKITAVKSRFTVMEDECAAPMVSARDGWHPDSRTERQRREPPSADCEGSLTLDLAGSSARGS